MFDPVDSERQVNVTRSSDYRAPLDITEVTEVGTSLRLLRSGEADLLPDSTCSLDIV